MTFPNLRRFLAQLERDGDLAVVDAPVDPNLELPEVHRRVIAADGPALLFRNPVGSSIPVATNLFGTARRVELAFGRDPQHFIERLVELAETMVPPTLEKIWGARDVGLKLARVGMKNRKYGPVTEVVDRQPDLTRIPFLTSWPEDGGPFLTLPLVYTEHPDDGRHNLGIYRMQRHDARRLGVHWQIGKGGGFHYHEAERKDEALPITVFLGGPPALLLSALAPLPENVGELLLTSLLLGGRVPRTRSSASPHPLIAEAEFAILGHVRPHERHPEGPFGDHYGYYSLMHDYPVMQVEAIAHRRDPIFPATVVGKPRQEDFFLGDFLQEMLAPLFPIVMPGVRDLWSYGETGYHSLAAAIVRDRYAREAMVSAFRILGEGQLSLTKFLLLTDGAVDLRDFRSLFEYVLARCRFESDLFLFGHLSMDTLDYTGPKVNKGSKGVMLGLGDPIRDLPRTFNGTPGNGIRGVRPYCAGCLVVDGVSYEDDPDWARAVAADPALEEWPMVMVVDDAVEATRTDARFLWTVFTRFEPAADFTAAKVDLVRNHPAFRPPVVIDARLKPGYPGELFCDPDTATQVGRRWREYFPKGVEMGDSEVGHLDRS